MADVSQLPKLRPCGRLETYSSARHHLNTYLNVGLTATYTCSTPASTPLQLQNLVFTALRACIEKHPTLSAIVINEEKSFPNVLLVRLPEIDLRKTVNFIQRQTPIPGDGEKDEELDALLKEQHATNFKDDLGKKAFFRIIVATHPTQPTQFVLSWVFHHVLGDGQSAFLFHETFVNALNGAKSEAEVDPIVKSPSTELIPSLEDLHPLPVSAMFVLKAILGLILPSIFAKRPPKMWSGKPVPKKLEDCIAPANVSTVILSASTMSKLAAAARKENTSVTGAFEALLVASVFAVIPEDFQRINSGGPMSMRRFVDVPKDQMVNAITQYDTVHMRKPQSTTSDAKALHYFSWSSARDVKSRITAALDKKGSDNPVALLKHVPDIHKWFLGSLGKERNSGIGMSNIGRYTTVQEKVEGPWSIGRIVFSQGADGLKTAIAVNAVTGPDGNAAINFSWSDVAVDRDVAEKVMAEFKKGVEALVADGEAK
jgi:hypothetical protein